MKRDPNDIWNVAIGIVVMIWESISKYGLVQFPKYDRFIEYCGAAMFLVGTIGILLDNFREDEVGNNFFWNLSIIGGIKKIPTLRGAIFFWAIGITSGFFAFLLGNFVCTAISFIAYCIAIFDTVFWSDTHWGGDKN